MALVYKIRRKSDGLFSTGGITPSFNKNGKIWKRIGHIKSHLRLVHFNNVYRDCELVTYEIVENQVEPSINLKEFHDDIIHDRALKDKQRQKNYLKWKKEQMLKEYQQLKKEIEQLDT